MKPSLVLLDRDGVINEDRPDSVKSIEELVLIDGSAEAIAMLNQAGIKVAVVTNQSVVGKGIISQQELDDIHSALAEQLAEHGAHWDALFVATDHPDQPTHRRKPEPGMLLEALEAFDTQAEQAPMVGDALRDMQAAHTAGCPRYLVRTGKGQALEQEGLPQDLEPVEVHDNLLSLVKKLLQS